MCDVFPYGSPSLPVHMQQNVNVINQVQLCAGILNHKVLWELRKG